VHPAVLGRESNGALEYAGSIPVVPEHVLALALKQQRLRRLLREPGEHVESSPVFGPLVQLTRAFQGARLSRSRGGTQDSQNQQLTHPRLPLPF